MQLWAVMNQMEEYYSFKEMLRSDKKFKTLIFGFLFILLGMLFFDTIFVTIGVPAQNSTLLAFFKYVLLFNVIAFLLFS